MGYWTQQDAKNRGAQSNFALGLPSSWRPVAPDTFRRWSAGRLFEVRREGRKWGLYEVTSRDVPPNAPGARFHVFCTSMDAAVVKTNQIADPDDTINTALHLGRITPSQIRTANHT